MKVAISGSTGMIGTALIRSLRSDGHEVIRLVRGEPPFPDAGVTVRWDPEGGRVDDLEVLAQADAVVHLAAKSIGDRRWNDEEKRRILDSRVRGTHLLADTLAGLDPRPPVLLSASAIGYYGDRSDEELTEQSAPGGGFMADVVRQWEAATEPAERAGVRVAHLRTGLVLSSEGGFLERPVKFFKVGLGGKLGDGRQWWSWIAIDDEVGAIRFLLEHDVSGPVNLTAPNPVTNAEFTKVLGRVLNRPAIFPVPRFAVQLLYGRELVDDVVFSGQKVLPEVLVNAGYEFRHTDVERALRAVLQRPMELA